MDRLAALLLSVWVAASAAAGQNLFENPGFEQGIDKWRVVPANKYLNDKWRIDTFDTRGDGSTKCFAHEVGASTIVDQAITTENGGRYEIAMEFAFKLAHNIDRIAFVLDGKTFGLTWSVGIAMQRPNETIRARHHVVFTAASSRAQPRPAHGTRR